MTEQIFISYSKKDSPFAHKLADDLTAKGFKTWIDRSISGGEEWRASIEDNLKTAGDVVIVISSHSMASAWVQHEGSVAYAWGKGLVPILIEPVQSLPPWLEKFQWVSFIDSPYETALDKLAAALTPPNLMQDFLNQELKNHKLTGGLIDDDMLAVIEKAREGLKINEEAGRLLLQSRQAIEKRMEKERLAEVELENARRFRDTLFKIGGLVSTTLLIVFLIVSNQLGAALRTAQAPLGALSITFSGDPANLNAILDSYQRNGIFLLGFNLGFEFLYMVIYATALSLGCFWASGRLKRADNHKLVRIGTYLGYTMWLAALFDAIEKFTVFYSILSTPQPLILQFAAAAAALKFSILYIGILYMIVGFLYPVGKSFQLIKS